MLIKLYALGVIPDHIMELRMNLRGLEFRLDTAKEMLPRLIAPWVRDLGLSLEAVDIEEPLDALEWRPEKFKLSPP
jgi:hypothetical protein